jgi:hypothetical protein
VKLLNDLHDTLAVGGRPATVALTGMAGIGKTTTAIEYAQRCAEDYDIAWWVAADDPARISEGLAALAQTLGHRAADETADAAVVQLRTLLRDMSRWLLIFDNAEAPDVLTPFLPPGPGHVLITSRNPAWRGVAADLPLELFDPAEAIQLIRDRLPSVSDEDAGRLAEALGNLPLVIQQAASLLDDTGMTIDRYLDLLEQRGTAVLASSGDSVNVTAAASWAIAFDRLSTDDPVALQLLTLIAWLAPEPIPLAMITKSPDALPSLLAEMALDPLDLARRTAIVRRRGLAHVAGSAIGLHRVPALLLRERTADVDSGNGLGWAETAVRVLHAWVSDDPSTAEWPQLVPLVRTVTTASRNLRGVVAEANRLIRMVEQLGKFDSSFVSPFIGDVIGGTLTTEEQVMISLMEPKDRARYLLQKKMQEKAEMAALTSQLQGLRHSTAMAVIKNIR